MMATLKSVMRIRLVNNCHLTLMQLNFETVTNINCDQLVKMYHHLSIRYQCFGLTSVSRGMMYLQHRLKKADGFCPAMS